MTRSLPAPYRRAFAATGLGSRARVHPDVSRLERLGGPPSARAILMELGSGLEAARLVGALPRLMTSPRGDGHTVIDIPGWRASELSGAPIRAYLRALGYDARGWGFGTNLGNPRADAERLARRVLELVAATGQPVSLVGWSLGGVIAREVARREPDAVRRVITYGTPIVGGARFTALARTSTPEAGAAADLLAARLDADDPIRVPLTIIFSRHDGVVSWGATIDRVSPYAEHVEVASRHVGLGIDPDVWRVVADRLARRDEGTGRVEGLPSD